MRAARLAFASLPALGLLLLAQGTVRPPAAYMSAADISKGLSTAVAADSAAGAAVTIVPGIVVRRRTGGGRAAIRDRPSVQYGDVLHRRGDGVPHHGRHP